MQSRSKSLRLGIAILTAAAVLAGSSSIVFAQSAAPAAPAITLTEPLVKALQEALNRQGIAVKTDGVLNEETRAAIRKYQSQHHLPVTGDADKATLDKLGVRVSAAPAAATAQAAPAAPGASAPAQATPQMPMQPGQAPQGGMMMNCPMMQGQMQAMMQMMQGMMAMMQQMHGQMQPGQMQPGQMQPGQMQPGQMQPGQMPGPMQPGMGGGARSNPN